MKQFIPAKVDFSSMGVTPFEDTTNYEVRPKGVFLSDYSPEANKKREEALYHYANSGDSPESEAWLKENIEGRVPNTDREFWAGRAALEMAGGAEPIMYARENGIDLGTAKARGEATEAIGKYYITHYRQIYDALQKAKAKEALYKAYQENLTAEPYQPPPPPSVWEKTGEALYLYSRMADGSLIFTLCISGIVLCRLIKTIAAKQKDAFPYLPHIISGLLLVSYLDLPYGYYVFLRLSVTAYALYMLVQHSDSPNIPKSTTKEVYIILAAGIAILYQPLIKAPFEKEVWCWINLAIVPAIYALSWPLKNDKHQ